MAADATMKHAGRGAVSRLLCLAAGLMLIATPLYAQSDASGQGGTGRRSSEPAGAAPRDSATTPSSQADPTPPRQTRPAPSVTPSEKILADSVVSFPVDI